jgi:hypothetical protein
MEIGLFTGGRDRPYAFGLVKALMSEGLRLHVVGGDELDVPEIHANSNLKFIDFLWEVAPGLKPSAEGLESAALSIRRRRQAECGALHRFDMR